MMLVLLALGLAQAIDGADPRASFDAVSRRVERGDRDEAGIADPFYREVLRSELEAREKLGERFGRERRIVVRGGRAPKEYLDDLEAAGIHVRAKWVEAFEKQDPIDLAMEDVTPLEALWRLCRKTDAHPYGGAAVAHLSTGALGERSAVAYRNFLVLAGWTRRASVADFAGPPKGGIAMDLEVMWDPGVTVVSLGRPVILEAVDEKGRVLAPAEAGFVEAMGEQYRTREDLELGTPGRPLVGLARTASVKIARLRGYVEAGIPAETSEFRFEQPGGGGAAVWEDAHYEVRLGGVWPFETKVGGAADTQLEFRVRVKGGSVEDLRKAVVEAVVAGLEKGPSYRFWGGGRVEKGEAVYRGLAVTEHREIPTLVVKVHRKVELRRVYFDLRDVALPK